MENVDTFTSCEDKVLLLCRKYDVSIPTVHEVMRDAEQLDNISRSVPLILECRLVTAVANHPCFVPENPLNGEVQVNSLLPYLSSLCPWVRSLACSLLRVFVTKLDPKGQHFETQVTIICKNLQTTYEESLRDTDKRFQFCQVIACSSLCSITISCAALLPLSAIKFVLLTLRTVLNIVANPAKSTCAFLYQVALDGLAKLLKCPGTWNVLSVLEKQDAATGYLRIFLEQLSSKDKFVDDLTVAKMLEVLDNTDVLDTVLKLPDKQEVGKLLKQLLQLLPPITSSKVPALLDVRWKSLSVIYRLLQLVKTQDISKLVSMFDRACCDPEQISRLRVVMRDSFTGLTL